MEIKKMVKRIFAIGAGATMLGATVMGAMAADLKNYPDMFVDDGVFNGLLVVGEKAAAVDNLALTDIASSMMYMKSDVSTVSVEGDAWKVEAGGDELEFGEAVGPAASGVVDFLDEDDLGALATGQLKSSKGTFSYEQYLHFDNAVINTTYAEDDDDITALYLKVPDNSMFARYELNFLTAAKSDIDASETYKLDDIEGKQLTMMGKTYDIVKAVSGNANSNQVTLTLMAGSVSETLLEGEAQTYTVNGKPYEVSLTFTDSSDRAKFVVNGEQTPLLDEGDTETLSDGTVLGLSEVLYQDYAGGIHQAHFFLGADKIVLEDDDITDTASSDELSVNDETVDGSDITITGSINDNATSTTDDGELEIDTIVINMTAQDDYFIAEDETLLGQEELDEKDLLFTQNWDIQFKGMTDEKTNEISVKPKSSEKEYELSFVNVNGDKIDVPLAYASAGTSVRFGDQDDPLLLNRSVITDEDYFILNDDTDEDSVTNIVQYKGADDNSKSDPKMKLKVLATGETLSRPITFSATNSATATLKLSGTTYNLANATATGSDDWSITVSSGGEATETRSVDTLMNFLIAKGGAKIWLTDQNSSIETDELKFNVSLIDSNLIDDAASVPYLVKGYNIVPASSELDFGSAVGITLVSPDGDDDNSYGWSANGAWVHLNSPSGTTSADTLTIDWPEDERTALVFVTSGATATTASGGSLASVTIIDATKLDSEVTSVSAQNLITVGGPCVNTVSAELLGNPSNCAEGFSPGKARIKLFENANGNLAMLVAGYSGADTRLAGKVVANRASELSGMEMEVEGTTYSDATLGAPSVAAPVEEVVEEAPAEEVVEEVAEE
ncbi:MAG: hypothetical protein KKA62_01475 [Nanoarchaeota archaeon]|nr:hypothetical protein [Nanoarchaeota archaeon]MBU1643569.1 hypothetical protein [Nanoarchaeota archaeon]MBU1976603.1 hypothetical protein [Nanoarchaeota archaeon]